jgi:hypothetical protein
MLAERKRKEREGRERIRGKNSIINRIPLTLGLFARRSLSVYSVAIFLWAPPCPISCRKRSAGAPRHESFTGAKQTAKRCHEGAAARALAGAKPWRSGGRSFDRRHTNSEALPVSSESLPGASESLPGTSEPLQRPSEALPDGGAAAGALATDTQTAMRCQRAANRCQ